MVQHGVKLVTCVFNSQPFCCHLATLGNLFIVTCSAVAKNYVTLVMLYSWKSCHGSGGAVAYILTRYFTNFEAQGVGKVYIPLAVRPFSLY